MRKLRSFRCTSSLKTGTHNREKEGGRFLVPVEEKENTPQKWIRSAEEGSPLPLQTNGGTETSLGVLTQGAVG